MSGPLAPHVRRLHHYDLAGYPPGSHTGMPSTAVTLVVPLDQELDLALPAGPRLRMTSCLAGLHDGPVTIDHDGTQRGLQVELDPLSLSRLLGVPAAALAGRAVGLEDVLGAAGARTLLDRLHAEPGWPVRRRLLQESLLQSMDRHERRPAARPEVAHAWRRLLASGGTARVSDVAAEVGWSRRHLVDRFAAEIGLPPKTVARIRRFERSVALVARGHALAEVAAACGFADQAHMTREWRLLAGTTPGRWPQHDVLANVQDGIDAGAEPSRP